MAPTKVRTTSLLNLDSPNCSSPGMLSAFMGFIEPGDEVIIFEPFFDQYVQCLLLAC